MKNLSFLFGFIFFLALAQIPDQSFAQNPLFSRIKKTIVIDPGHGGNDAGAKGTDSTLEKDITLSFAKALETILKKTYNVTLTRTDDYFLDVHSRTEIANQSRADLFISLHTGGNFIHESQGIGIYYFERALEARVGRIKNNHELTINDADLFWNGVQEKYSPISRAVALSLSEQISRSRPHQNIRVTGLAADVLSGADMPAIIIELGYMTSPFDEKHLVNPSYMFDFSHEISLAIDKFFNTYSQ